MSDSRDSERVPILGDLRGEITVLEPLTVKELGRGGATIETTFRLPLNSLHDIRLTLGEQTIVVKSRVVHSHISEVGQDVVSYHTGLEFVEPPPYVGAAITRYLDDVRTQRHG